MCKVVFLSPFDIASQIVSCLKIKGLLGLLKRKCFVWRHDFSFSVSIVLGQDENKYDGCSQDMMAKKWIPLV